MLAAQNLLNALCENEEETYKNNNDDLDFGMVLQFCGGSETTDHELVCSDGQKRKFSFDN